MRLSFVDPGWLNTRLTLEEQVRSADGQGGETIIWSAVGALWAMVDPRTAKAGEDAGIQSATITHHVTIRIRPDVQRGMRFDWQGRALLIKSVFDPDATGRYLVCRCEEAAP